LSINGARARSLSARCVNGSGKGQEMAGLRTSLALSVAGHHIRMACWKQSRREQLINRNPRRESSPGSVRHHRALQKGRKHLMLNTLTVPVVLGIAFFLICSLPLSVFSFWIGRCARKIPIIDNNLPWTMRRARALRCTASCKRTSASCLTPDGAPSAGRANRRRTHDDSAHAAGCHSGRGDGEGRAGGTGGR
jgi:hypothetical protein